MNVCAALVTGIFAPAKVVAPVPPFAIGKGVPEYVMANVPLLVIGLPEILKMLGTVAATLVTDPAPGPVKAISIEPAPGVIVTPEPAVKDAFVKVLPVLLPIKSWPLVKLVWPVPPFATDKVPVTAVSNGNPVDAPVPPLATGKMPLTPVDKGKLVAFVKFTLDGVPNAGVTKVGELVNTRLPVPVSSVTAAARFADDGVAKKVAMPVPRPETPVEIGKPVAFVRVTEEGVPKAGVTSVGLLDNTLLPEPVLVPTPVPPFVTFSNGPASNNASIVSRSELSLVPQLSVDAPTSGLVSNRFVVVVSAIFRP